MIDIAKLTDADKGRGVIYTPHHSTPENPDTERGVISSWNDTYIFVRYGPGSTAAATDPEQLEWEQQVTDQELRDKAEGLVWCQCHSMVREGGMCSEGFCHPDPLSPTCPVDRVLIENYK